MKQTKKNVAAAILTGGQSSRMGRDKSLLRFQGQTLTALTALKLKKAGYDPIFVVGPPKSYGLPSGIAVISERHLGKGPISGVEAALRYAKGPCLVVPCDLPRLNLNVLKRFRRAYHGKKSVTFRGHPLPAIFNLEILEHIKKSMASKNYALYPLVANAKLIELGKSQALFNLNDLKSLREVKRQKRDTKM